MWNKTGCLKKYSIPFHMNSMKQVNIFLNSNSCWPKKNTLLAGRADKWFLVRMILPQIICWISVLEPLPNIDSTQSTLAIDNISSTHLLRFKTGILLDLQRWVGSGRSSCCWMFLFTAVACWGTLMRVFFSYTVLFYIFVLVSDYSYILPYYNLFFFSKPPAVSYIKLS